MKEIAIKSGIHIASTQSPELGQALMFLHGNWGSNPSFGEWIQNAVGHAMQYQASMELERIAEKHGLTLGELNLILIGNSYLGREVAGTTYSSNNASIQGYFSRDGDSFGKATPYIGVIWDVNDTILNTQGLPDAVSMGVIRDPGRSSHLTGHSLGAWRVNNLVRMGYIDSGTLLSLPVLTYPAVGTTGVCATRDLICGGSIGAGLMHGVSPVNSQGMFPHTINAVEGYKTNWPGP